MKNNAEKRSELLEALRIKAREKMKSYAKRDEKYQFKDIAEYIEVLNTYQVELEMQIDELIAAQEELERLKNNYSDLYDFAPVGYFTFEKNGIIAEVNLTGANFLGVDRSKLINKPFVQFIHKDNQDDFHIHCRNVLKSQARQVCEIELLSKNEIKVYVKLESNTIKNNKFGLAQMRTIMSDISERKIIIEELEIENKKLKEKIIELSK